MSIFNRYARRRIAKGKFDLSHEFKFTCDMGKLIPVCCQEVLPGDKFKVSNQAILKLTAQLAPVMHNVQVFFRHFYVPNRLIWDDWESFITGGKDGASAPVAPYFEVNKCEKFSLTDYLYHLPNFTGATQQDLLKFSALPARAYNFIYNEYFRDKTIQDAVSFSTASGKDTTTPLATLNVNWEKDYFTSCRPTPQAGSGTSFKLGTTAPVYGTGKALTLVQSEYSGNAREPEPPQPFGLAGWSTPSGTSGTSRFTAVTTAYDKAVGTNLGSGAVSVGEKIAIGVVPKERDNSYYDSPTGKLPNNLDSGLEADLTDTDISIENLRNAFKVQEYLEKLIRSGHDFKDWLLSFFGVKSSDARLDKPEYIGGGCSQMMFSEILQTSETGTTALGQQAGHSSSLAGSKFYTKFFPEHGWFITLMYIRPRTQYMQGIARQFSRQTRYDYYLPEFANLGEQAVLKKEIFTKNGAWSNDVFGYQPRYQEYRSVESCVGGELSETMKYWHLSREFDNQPSLNGDFLKCNPSNRIYATTADSHVIVDCANYIYAVRPIPKYVRPATLF